MAEHSSLPPHLPASRAMALVLAIFLLFCCATGARAAVAIQQVTSEKGITAWLVEDYTVPIIAVRFAVNGGSSQDPPGKEGLVNLMTGLFDEGAGNLDSDAFQIRLDDAGAEMAFSEGRDVIYGSMRMLAERRDEAFELLHLAVEKPRFDAGPVERIRSQILSGIVANENDPDTIANRKWIEALYGAHPYARRAEGTRESLAAITPQDLHAAHRAMFARDGLHVAVVGAIDPETLKRKLDEVFGGLPETQHLVPVPDIVPKLAQTVQVNYDRPQTSLRLAYPGLPKTAPDLYAAAVMNQILGGGTFTSRLFREVRDKRGLAYSVDSTLVSHKHASALLISTATSSERASEALEVVREVVRHMADDGPSADELAAAKKYLIGAYAINNLNSSSAIASTLVQLQLDGRGIDYMQRRASYIDAVSLDEVRAVAKKLLSADPAVLVVGPALAGGVKE